MTARHLFIMVKEPRVGRVKTRLGAGLGAISATWWFRHQTRDLIARLGRDARWQTWLAVSPDVEGLHSRVWPAHLPRWAQGGGDLGARMARIFCSAPNGRVVIIGADIPNITPSLIDKAFRMLGAYDGVFGPSPDGGFWLMGLHRGARAVPKTLFNGVRWSSAHSLRDTLKTLDGQRIGYIDTLRDVDDISDLARLKKVTLGQKN